MSKRHRNPEIYVKGYSSHANKDDLRGWFKEFGKIIEIQYKGLYSFIEFEDYYDAEAAIERMDGQKVEGRRLTVEAAGKKRYNRSSRSRTRKHRKRR